jgi:hypothetical protein
MIAVTVTKQRNPRTGQVEEIVSHGIDMRTDKTVVLPPEPMTAIGARFDRDLVGWVLKEGAFFLPDLGC